ncbi:prephenate dehydrogenase [Ilyobacter polytropus]|uniref:Prephenate dehydrogenase n=1 Tax=Ilyobacter polytropus (strain ATCC 51220 / DSM 2926 / LMG 16218 / CuHBu1) TaxID=572544 RepID=E3HDH9_ILYPC|nr:prephenate dehydrogenase [Ilyobacter polytropus]ADO84165.1 Prephenate dehydrogenase [Ilyobacter polytropus DSM 2926]
MKIAVVGLGLIGASVSKGLLDNGHEVYGVDIDQDAINYCEKNKLISKGFSDMGEVLEKCKIVLFSVYPKTMISLTEKYIDKFKKGTIVTDVSGVKKEVVAKMQRLLPTDVEFVGVHPMAGREKIGAEYSDPNIFKGANYIITPTEENSPSALKLLEDIGIELGFKKISYLTPERHDEMIAFTSQLTHAIAVALVNSDKDPDTYNFTGDSYRELTRIAMINGDLWSELFLENRENLIDRIEEFQERLDIIKEALKNNDRKTLITEFEKSTKKRLTLEK